MANNSDLDPVFVTVDLSQFLLAIVDENQKVIKQALSIGTGHSAQQALMVLQATNVAMNKVFTSMSPVSTEAKIDEAEFLHQLGLTEIST